MKIVKIPEISSIGNICQLVPGLKQYAHQRVEMLIINAIAAFSFKPLRIVSTIPRMLRSCLLICLLSFAGVSVSAQNLPHRIVSMNLCTDQLLLLLVDKSRIASLSYFAGNPDYSAFANLAENIPANRGQADEVITYNPDLILTSQYSATLAANMLERMNYKVHRLGFAASADDVYQQIGEIAALTGTVAKGESLIADIKANIALQQNALRQQLQGKSAVFFASNGFTYGSFSLQDSFIRSLGMRNIAADAGITGPALLSLELLLAAKPDYLFMDQSRALDAQLAHPMLQHPALASLAESTRTITLPDTYFQCAGPQLALAYTALAEQLRDEN
jgi:iron complex transport system substrate-binding protein